MTAQENGSKSSHVGAQANLREPSDFWILVAEDDFLARYLTVTCLVRHGYNVLEAEDGLDALWVANHHVHQTIHLLLCDISMPNMNGYELVSRLASQRPEMEVMVLSAIPRKLLSEECADYAKVLTKPAIPKCILASVREILGA